MRAYHPVLAVRRAPTNAVASRPIPPGQNTVAQAAATKKWRQRSDTKSTTVSTDITIPGSLGPTLAEATYKRLYYDFVLP